jgi:hypothetical protein
MMAAKLVMSCALLHWIQEARITHEARFHEGWEQNRNRRPHMLLAVSARFGGGALGS